MAYEPFDPIPDMEFFAGLTDEELDKRFPGKPAGVRVADLPPAKSKNPRRGRTAPLEYFVHWPNLWEWHKGLSAADSELRKNIRNRMRRSGRAAFVVPTKRHCPRSKKKFVTHLRATVRLSLITKEKWKRHDVYVIAYGLRAGWEKGDGWYAAILHNRRWKGEWEKGKLVPWYPVPYMELGLREGAPKFTKIIDEAMGDLNQGIAAQLRRPKRPGRIRW